MAKRVTYLIGAGASANALPVVNGMNERMKMFYDFLLEVNSDLEIVDRSEFKKLYDLLSVASLHQTIDTYAKKLWYKDDLINYNLLKRFLSCYLIFEQTDKYKEDNEPKEMIYNEEKLIVRMFSKPEKFFENKSIESNYKNSKQKDERYDSFYAANLMKNKELMPYINIVSWNYDMQYELAYSDFWNDKLLIDNIQKNIQVFPLDLNQKINREKSSIIKINGTGNFKSSNENLLFDIINSARYEKDFLINIFKVLFNLEESLESEFKMSNQLKFAWEDDEQVTKARNYAHEVIRDSDAVVIIGYSFPTFNRDIDRILFSGFNKDCLTRSAGKVELVKKKIYIQDMPKNAPKIRERLKAVGDNLFDVAEIYDDVDQFFIPPEL